MVTAIGTGTGEVTGRAAPGSTGERSEGIAPQKTSATKAMRVLGGLSLVLAPLGLAIGWALNYDSLAAFFDFNVANLYLTEGRSASNEQFLATITSPDGGFRSFALPHYFVYVSMPIFIAASLYLARSLFGKAPWLALIGATLTSIGAVYFIGVLGAWLSFPAIATIPVGQPADLLPILATLSKVQGILLVSTMLSILLMVGMMILGVGLFRSRIVPRKFATLVILGNLLILAFGGVENWMVVGAILMLIGLSPLAIKGLLARNQDWAS